MRATGRKFIGVWSIQKWALDLYSYNERYTLTKKNYRSAFYYRLVDTLDAFLEHNNLTPIPRFADEFPDSITLAQTVAVWKYIIQYQDRQKREGPA